MMKVTFRCRNCERELKNVYPTDSGEIKCHFCDFSNKLKQDKITCPNCTEITTIFIPHDMQFWSSHHADSQCKVSSKNDVLEDFDRYETNTLGNEGEISVTCQQCREDIHVIFKQGKIVGRYCHAIEKIGEYIPKKMGKPTHAAGTISDRNFQKIMPFFFLFIFAFALHLGVIGLKITSGLNLESTLLDSTTGRIFTGIIYAIFFVTSYFFLKKIKDIACDMEVHVADDRKAVFYKALRCIFSAKWLLFYFSIMFVIFTFDNFGTESLTPWIADIFDIPYKIFGAIIGQIFVGYGILLLAVGGGPHINQAFTVDFFKARNTLQKASSINYQIAISISALSTAGVLNQFYFWSDTAKEIYGNNIFLLFYLPLLMFVILLSFIGYSLLLQNITNKIKRDTLEEIDKEISDIISRKKDIGRRKDVVQAFLSIKQYLDNNRIGVVSKDTAIQAIVVVFVSSFPYLLEIIKAINA